MENTSNHYSQQSSIASRIADLGGKYDPDSGLSIEDQFFICELLADEVKSKRIIPTEWEEKKPNEVSVKWSGNDSYKRTVVTSLAETKRNAIEKLRTFTHKTPPIEIANNLQELFVDYPSHEGHWLYIAQHWNPRAINRVIDRMIKLHSSGKVTIQNPPAYFTRLIQFRRKRRSL